MQTNNILILVDNVFASNEKKNNQGSKNNNKRL